VRVVGGVVPAYLRAMPETVVSRPPPRPLLVVAAVAVVILGGTVALWAHYGAAVFFETIRAGFVACFG
jgi:hypothetical protein